jgi:hypothetical protein
MTASTELLSASWTPLPGPLELLEQGDLDEDVLADAGRGISGTRGGGSGLNPAAWRRLLDRLRGLHRAEVLVDSVPSWIDLVELHVPPAGHAELTRHRSTERTLAPELKIFGFGFGSGMTTKFAETITFDARTAGKILQVRMLVTAIRYVDRDGGSVVRVDVSGPSAGAEHRIAELSPGPGDVFDPARWTLLRRADLSAAAEEGTYSWTYTAGRQAKWNIGLTLGGAPSVPLVASLQAEVSDSEEFETSFELPYGHDVIFYRRTGEFPLAPHCTVTPANF